MCVCVSVRVHARHKCQVRVFLKFLCVIYLSRRQSVCAKMFVWVCMYLGRCVCVCALPAAALQPAAAGAGPGAAGGKAPAAGGSAASVAA